MQVWRPRKKLDKQTWSRDRTGLEGTAPNFKGERQVLSQSSDLAKL